MTKKSPLVEVVSQWDEEEVVMREVGRLWTAEVLNLVCTGCQRTHPLQSEVVDIDHEGDYPEVLMVAEYYNLCA